MKIIRLTIGNTILILAFILLLFAAEVIGATYYVSPSGSDRNPGTKARPFRNIEAANSVVDPGDTVIVKDGKYTDHNSDGRILRITRGGTASKWVTYQSENTWGAVLNGKDQTTDFGILLGANSAYVKIVGFALTGIRRNGIHLNTASHDILISHNKIYKVGRVARLGGSGIYTGADSRFITIDRNIIHDVGRKPSGHSHDYRHDHCLYLRGAYHLVINNIFYNHRAGYAVSARGYDGAKIKSASTAKIINNTFGPDMNPNPHTDADHINLYQNSGDDHPPLNVIIDNNVFYNGQDGTIISVGSGTDSGNLYFRNNRASNDTYIDIARNSSAELIKSNNVIGLALSSFNLKDPSNHDYRLKQNASYLIDQGRSTNAPDHDFLNIARPQGAADDIGAFEYGDSNTTADAPEPPDGLRVIQ
jgi:hypothetical protein